MSRKEPHRVERNLTDDSLRTERQKTDDALAEKQAAVERDADAVIQHAREIADAVLTDARDKADVQLDEMHAPRSAHDLLAHERAREDRALRDERSAADESLERERHETNTALARLLPLERVKTDRYLLTERSRSDDALASRDDFLGIVSHDLRNLLGGIVMSAGHLAHVAAGPPQGTHVLAATARINRYAARMNRLISDLLDVASIDAGKLAIRKVPEDIGAVVCEAVELLQADAVARQIKLTSDVDEPVPADFDHDRILQVLANLISNAVKFTPEGGSVCVRAEVVDGAARVSVEDTGAGIAEGMLDAVFQRFWQATDSDHRGLGLGLYISRSIINAHGGRIWATSTVGKGSTFTFTLPPSTA